MIYPAVINVDLAQISSSRLLALPPELRNNIFELVVYQAAKIELASSTRWTSCGQPALSCVNRQLRAEALPLFYDVNNFRFVLNAYHDDLWPADISFIRAYIPYLRHIEVARRERRGYFTLEVSECSGREMSLGRVWDATPPINGYEACYWASPQKLIAGQSYLSALSMEEHRELTLEKLRSLLRVLNFGTLSPGE